MPTYYVWTIGCQMNKAESERLGACLEMAGYDPVFRPQEADVVILNTCVVRGSAEQRVVGELGYLGGLKKKAPQMKVVVTGCFVSTQVEEVKRRFPQVDASFPPGYLTEFVEYLEERKNGASEVVNQIQFLPYCPSVATFVPVMQGCDNFCTYCIVPYRRGREQSRPVGEIVCEVNRLVQRGAREVTLLGQNVNAYGRNLPDQPNLSDLLGALNETEGLARIRFLTSHPRDINHGFVDAMAAMEKVCHHINIPVQSGSDRILRKMGRGYTVAEYRSVAEALRRRMPEIGLSTDVIVGFPGETEDEFFHTVGLLSELRFDTVHVAAYSPRPGTMAAGVMDDDVSRQEKTRRVRTVEELQEGIAAKINARLLREEVEVLVETRKKDKWQGRTRSNRLVFFSDGGDWTGKLVWVEVTKTGSWSLQGRLVSGSPQDWNESTVVTKVN